MSGNRERAEYKPNNIVGIVQAWKKFLDSLIAMEHRGDINWHEYGKTEIGKDFFEGINIIHDFFKREKFYETEVEER